eukprot:gb/GECH01014404.1/.p1 GENE.gb/GECH01014404.1/~~gb/GECH01014404.1/.p1  ORF type:complete len:235 (+),score=62.82 gb/GECH01014404.1/:1-705(+)
MTENLLLTPEVSQLVNDQNTDLNNLTSPHKSHSTTKKKRSTSAEKKKKKPTKTKKRSRSAKTRQKGIKTTIEGYPFGLPYIFSTERDYNLKEPYYKTGDPEMETRQAKDKRNQLRHNPGLCDAIKRFCNLFPKEDSGKIHKDTYLKIHSQIAQILLPSVSKEQIHEAAKQDWESDSQGGDYISEPQIFEAIFELTDLWTATTDATEYLMFLETLLNKLKFGPETYDPKAYSILE